MNASNGKVCVITGATSGIGLVAAEALAAKGMRILLIARDRARAEIAKARIARAGPAATAYYGDLALIADMKRVASEIAAAEPKIDVLINCAGAAFSPREETPDGLEKTFALNHLSYFVVTNLLLSNLRAAAPSGIVNVASDGHHYARLDFADLQMRRGYRGFTAYATSKLANILFTRELARRLVGTGIVANAMHPGIVNTRWGNNVGGLRRAIIGLGKSVLGRSPAKGAETIVYLATAPEAANVSGKYFIDCSPATPTAAAQSDTDAKLLWDESVKLTGVGG